MPRDCEYQKKTNIRDLFFHILYRWRSILAAALIGALLLGGYAYMSNRNKTKADKTTAAAEETTEAGTLRGNYEASNALYQHLLDDNIQYREQSIVMRINPYQVWKATAAYAVVPDGTDGTAGDSSYDPLYPIAAAYSTLVFDELDINRLKQIYGDTDLNYINEVVTVKSPASGAHTFSVITVGLTREMADESLASMQEMVEKASRGSIQQVGKHKIVLLSRYIRQTVDTDMESRQAAVAKNIATYQTAITNNNSSISKAPSAVKTTTKTSKKPGALYAAAGLALGMLLLACCYGAGYLFSDKLRSARELTERFGVPVYGAVNHSRARRPGKGIDKLIEKWEFRKARTDAGTALEGAGALIREHGGEGGILLTGTIPAEKIRPTADRLAEILGEKARITVEGAFLQNSKAITAAADAAAVILVEEVHESETDDIRRVLEMLRMGKADAVGAVTV